MLLRPPILLLLLLASYGQAASEDGKFALPAEHAEPEPIASPIADIARLVGVSGQIRELHSLTEPGPPGSPQQWQRLWLHQQINERVAVVQLQADATVASIDNEIARATEVRGYLADKRDRSVTRANLLSALLGGGFSAASAALQLSTRQLNATVATGIAGGTISSGLGLYGIRAQRGGGRPFDAESNMLAPLFGRPELPTSHYPPVIWQFLNEIAPSDPDGLIRRERLIRTWLELKRVDSPDTSSGRTKIEHVTSMPGQHLTLSIDDLEDRSAMLQDVRAKLSFLKRDLAALLLSISDTDTPAAAAQP